MKRGIAVLMAVVLAPILWVTTPTGAAEGAYRDIDTRWKALGDTLEVRQEKSRELRAQHNTYKAARNAGHAALKAGDYGLAEKKFLKAAGLGVWSWVAAWHYNNAAYAIILAYDADQATVKDLLRAKDYLDRAYEALDVARACDICHELRPEDEGNIRACAEKVQKNRAYILERTQGE